MNTPSKTNKSIRIWLPLLFSMVLIGGMMLGFKLQKTLSSKRDISTLILRNDRLEELIELINARYVDTVNSNMLYQDAINGILSHLDPHTVYIPAEKLAKENEMLDGQFFGIGVEFNIYNDTIFISSVMPDGPAGKAGVSIGDRIIKVGDTLVAGTGITSERIISHLKGAQFSPVVLTIQQAITDRKRLVTLKRDVVPIYSIDASFMLDDKTGYIKISRFAATTHAEFQKAIKRLEKQNLQQLIVDLRGNLGGYLKASTSIADELIPEDKLLVYTVGANTDRTEEFAGEENLFETGKLAIIIDENSASASEILAGAIQDWDRGLVTGRQSYGKGLVQQQFELPDGSAIRLTTSRYYTPSGRSIQRSFHNGKKAYYDDYYKRNFGVVDTLIPLNTDTTKYFTGAQRVVYAEGGITPDVIIQHDSGKVSQQVLDIIYSNEFRSALRTYYLLHRDLLKQYRDIYHYRKSFADEKTIFQDYLYQLSENAVEDLAPTLNNPLRKRYLLLQVKAQLARFLFGDYGYYFVLSIDDPFIIETLQVLNSAQYSTIIGGQ